MSRATEDRLSALHGLLADSLMAEIEGYRRANVAIPANLLAQAIKFLKDNGIDSPALTGGKIDRLAASLPDMDELDNVLPFKR